MPQWSEVLSEQVKQVLDMTALPTTEYDSVLEKLSEKEYNVGEENRYLADLLTEANFRVAINKGIVRPDHREKISALIKEII